MAVSESSAQPQIENRLAPGRRVVGVLMGGPSSESKVSFKSGRAVAGALETRGHEVVARDVRPGDVTPDLVSGLDAVFIALHGEWGEDGGIQAELEILGVPYTGSGPEASRLAMHKADAKERFDEAGVPTPAFGVVVRGDDKGLKAARDALGTRLVAKPLADGSSIGVALCDSPEALERAARTVWQNDEAVLVERLVEGRELTVGVLGHMPLPLIEIRVPGGWYDYHHKYTSERTEYVFDHGLPGDVERQVVETALKAHEALGCRDLSRVDLMLDPDGGPMVLEVNTIPGFTDHSLVPKAAAQAGIPFPRLCERIVELALERTCPEPASREASDTAR